MRQIVAGLGGVLLVGVVVAAAFLAEAHWEMRAIAPELPETSALTEALAAPGGPVAIHFINTAVQRGGPGPTPIGHPAFLLEWPDGRGLLIDVGMDRAGARAFGKPFELLFGADPIEFRGAVADQLGDAAAKLAGIAFTHLHPDHTGGLPALCTALSHELAAFQTPWQADRGNYTTAPGMADIEAAGCARRQRLAGGPIYPFPGFPGLVAVAAGGHTPGSTLYFARVGDTIWGLAGDVSNVQSALLANQPKPRVYSLLITPEATGRLEELRRWLAALDAEPAFHILVSHDTDAIAASGLPPLAAPTPAGT